MKLLTTFLTILLLNSCGDDDKLNLSQSKEKLSDINHVITYGQSLAIGFTDRIITKRPENRNVVSFDGYVQTTPYTTHYPNTYSSLEPMYEITADGSPFFAKVIHETPTSGTCYRLYSEIKKSQNFDGRIVGSCPAEGGMSIQQLSKGGKYYQRVIDDVKGGYELAEMLGESYKVLAVTWTQGEADYYFKTSKQAYRNWLTLLIRDLNEDIKGITRQRDDVQIVMYQTSTINNMAETPNIALAQYEVAMENDLCHLATPSYHLEYFDIFHLKAESSRLLGEYYGYTINKAISNDGTKPIHPVGNSIEGNNLYLDFYVPVKPLVFEQIKGGHLGKRGFKVMKDGKDILFGVNIDDNGTTLKMVCTENPKGAIVQYGFKKLQTTTTKINLGYLRDSQGEDVKATIEGKEYKMHNWCPIFEYKIN